MLSPADVRVALQVGETAPEIQAQGWLNGPPPPLGEQELLVVDLWGQWCPYSASTAPTLTKVFEQYRERGVKFVSLTSDARDVVERFAATHHIGWPMGYEMDLMKLNEWGARETMPVPGYEVKPTLYVIDKDRKVVFCDGALRHRHTEPEAVFDTLAKALDAALADRKTPPPADSPVPAAE